MPVDTSYRPRPSIVSRSRIEVSRVSDYRAPPHQTSSSAVTRRRVSSTIPVVMRMQPSHPGSLERSRTKMLAGRERLDERAGARSRMHEHEIRRARPRPQSEPGARLRQHRPGLVGPERRYQSQYSSILERNRQRRGRIRVEAVWRHDLSKRLQRLGMRDDRAGAKAGKAVGLRERATDRRGLATRTARSRR